MLGFAPAQNLLAETLHFHPTPFPFSVKLSLQMSRKAVCKLGRKAQSCLCGLPSWLTSFVGHPTPANPVIPRFLSVVTVHWAILMGMLG